MLARDWAVLACTCGFAWLTSLAGPALAEDSPEAVAAREARLKGMQQIAARFKVQKIVDDKPQEVPLLEAPLLRFNDPAREFHDATLWGWGEAGRPLCLLAVEQYGDRSWFECISLSSARFTAEAEVLRWAPKASGLELQPFPGAAPASDKAPRRLVQMKELLGQLRAYEVGRTGSKYELRLMPKPLIRYDDEKAELVDGAVFAFAYGTNPELLAVLEARGAATAAAWQIGFARCGTAEPHVLLDEKEIFTLPYATGTGPEDPYWNFSYTFKPSPPPEKR
jgi:hypothetical protein